MACTPSDSKFNPPEIPAIGIPGFPGLPTAPLQPTIPGFTLPTSLIEDILELVNRLKINWPTGAMKPIPDGFMKTVMDHIMDLFKQLAPFLSFFKFITAILNMIVCIIEVLCALPNPVAVGIKLVKLFRDCLPDFLALFPPLALPVMILSIILLILALIEYLINTIINFINQIVQNLINLGKAITNANADSIAAIQMKIATLLCGIQNLFACLTAIAAIIAIVKALMAVAGGFICDSGDANSSCCSEEICPPFILNNPEGLSGTLGQMTYHKRYKVDFAGAGLDPTLFPVTDRRAESWQFVNSASLADQEYKFLAIVTKTPIYENTFWPEGMIFNSGTNAKKVPYTVDLKLTYDPVAVNPLDIFGPREFNIKDCIVTSKPYFGILDYQGGLSLLNFSGTLTLEGGLVTNLDGTPYVLNGSQATLNTFIHQEDVSGSPSSEDALVFNNITYTLKFNHPVLAGLGLISFGCLPNVVLEKKIVNSTNDLSSVLSKLPPNTFPDVEAAQACLESALALFRTDVSIENAAVFQQSITACLDKLASDSSNSFCLILNQSVSAYKSTFTIDPSVQFTTRSIGVTVNLKDTAGVDIANSLPASCSSVPITAEVTLGKISDFVYDGQSKFIGQITSAEPGKGTIKVLFDNKVISQILQVDGSTTIVETELPYEFINVPENEAVRRDQTDVVNS